MDGSYIKLSQPITVGAATIDEIALKEPSGALFMRLGEPRIGVATAEGGSAGSWYFVEQPAVINSYLEKLLVFDGVENIHPHIVLSQISLVDALTLKRTLFSFFEIAATKVAAQVSRSTL